jgi:GT2 family glycosyltransferase
MKSIAVVLVDWNGVEVTKECLASLKKVDTSFLDRFQIIVVDNGSDVPSKDLLEDDFSDIVFITSSINLGFAGGNNLGIKYAIENGFTYTLLLNNDTTVAHDFLKPLFGTMEINNTIVAAQPKIYFAHNRSLLWNAGNKFDRIFGTTSTRGYNEIDKGHYNEVATMPWLTGCCMLIRNEVLKHHVPSLLNERFKTYFEDVKLSFDLRKAGYQLMYVPASKIWHIAGYSAERNKDKEGKKFPEIVYLHTRNKIWIARAYSLPLTRPLAMLWQYGYCLLLLTYYALKGRWKKYNKVIQAMQDGWRSQPC